MGDALRYMVEFVDVETYRNASGPVRCETGSCSHDSYESFAEAHAVYLSVKGPKRLVAVLAEDLGA